MTYSRGKPKQTPAEIITYSIKKPKAKFEKNKTHKSIFIKRIQSHIISTIMSTIYISDLRSPSPRRVAKPMIAVNFLQRKTTRTTHTALIIPINNLANYDIKPPSSFCTRSVDPSRPAGPYGRFTIAMHSRSS